MTSAHNARRVFLIAFIDTSEPGFAKGFLAGFGLFSEERPTITGNRGSRGMATVESATGSTLEEAARTLARMALEGGHLRWTLPRGQDFAADDVDAVVKAWDPRW